MTTLEYNLYESFENITDCSGNYVDSSGNTVDCSGNIVTDPSNNTITTDPSNNTITTDASGNPIIETTTTTTTSNSSSDNEDNDKDIITIILTYENLYVLFWIISVYFILYSILAFFFRRNDLGYVYDLIILLTIVGIIVAYKFMTDSNEYKDDAEENVDTFLNFFDDKYNIIYIVAGLIFLYVLTSLFGVSSDTEYRPTFVIGLETLLFILLILIIFVQFYKEFMDISLTNELRERLGIIEETPDTTNTTTTTTTTATTPQPTPVLNKEVFNVGGNHYTYEDAEAICKSFDADLADYDQIEQSYNNGGEWCNYGWSKNQMALFPTQKSTWNKLQSNEKNKNNCGRPGINGGYMANPALRFGVNCYGVKPTKRSIDFGPQSEGSYTSSEDRLMNSKIDFWKNNMDKLKLNHYNSNDWSRY